MGFTWEDYEAGNTVVFCRTEKDAVDFVKKARERGLMCLTTAQAHPGYYKNKEPFFCPIYDWSKQVKSINPELLRAESLIITKDGRMLIGTGYRGDIVYMDEHMQLIYTKNWLLEFYPQYPGMVQMPAKIYGPIEKKVFGLELKNLYDTSLRSLVWEE